MSTQARAELQVTASHPLRRALPRWLGPLLVLAVTGIMAAWSWGTWADPVVDFGRELYVPWQLARGQVLYRDLAYFNGPLSPYVNALVFATIGPGLRHLVIFNLLVILAVLALIYRLILALADHLAATVACLTFVLLFAFSQYTRVANYNWVCPYSHEMTHGVALSLLSLLLLHAYDRRRGVVLALLAGVTLGLVFLTKAEIFLAAATMAAAYAALMVRTRREVGHLVAAGVASLVPAGIAWLLFWLAMPVGEALSGTLGSWPHVLHREHAEMLYFRRGMGLLDPAMSVMDLLVMCGWYAAVLLPPVVVALLCRRPGAYRVAVGGGLFVLLLGVLLWRWQPLESQDIGLPLPLWSLLAALTAGAALLRRPDDPLPGARARLQMALAIFSLVLLLKIILNVRIWHYGFALAMPAAMLLVALLTSRLPALVARRGGAGWVALAAVLAVWLVAVTNHLRITQNWFRNKTVQVGSGADAFRADYRGKHVQAMVEEIQRRSAPDATLTVLPDGEIVNYLARRRNPIPYGQFNPATVLLYGEQHMLEAVQQAPPDWVLLVHRDYSEYGYAFFGRDFAIELGDWISQNYSVWAHIGGQPGNREGRFGMILQRRTDAQSTHDRP